jgi:hypothetical protein
MKAGSTSPGVVSRTEQPPAPVTVIEPPSPPNWVAIAALVLSILTLFKTLYGDWRAWRTKRGTRFETDYGTPIRTGLRTYEETLFTLRAFIVPSGKDIDALKVEVEPERAKWIEGADKVIRLLREADDSGSLLHHGWSTRFEHHAQNAEDAFLEMTEDAIVNADDLRKIAQKAQDDLNVAIIEVRTALREEALSYERLFKRS